MSQRGALIAAWGVVVMGTVLVATVWGDPQCPNPGCVVWTCKITTDGECQCGSAERAETAMYKPTLDGNEVVTSETHFVKVYRNCTGCTPDCPFARPCSASGPGGESLPDMCSEDGAYSGQFFYLCKWSTGCGG